MDNFAHLHVHSFYSLLDGIDSPEELVKAAVKNGQTALAITDHGSLASHRRLHKAALEAGIKPIFGVEAYISPTDRFDKRSAAKRDDDTSVYNHIILLAKNQTGYENINRMSEIAWTEGFYHKPRIDTDLLKEYSEGVIVLTGCRGGIPAKLIEAGRYDKAKLWLEDVHAVFGDDLYLEVQAHNPQEINDGLEALSVELGIKMVATSDCHRAYKHDADLQDAFLILSTKPKKADGQTYATTVGMDLMERMDAIYPDRVMTFKEYNLYMQSRSEIEADFDNYFDTEIFDNTMEIVDKIGEYEFYENLDLLPTEFEDPAGELEFKCLTQLKARGLDKRYYDRLDEELRVIKSKKFSPYFLIVEDIVSFARKNDILVGPGRGSAAGSLVCFLLGITSIDPIEDELLFFRFINEERDDFPDIDMDFQRERRGEIKEYLRQKYGHVASIATYAYFTEKTVIEDAARVLSVPIGSTKKVLKNIETFDEFMTTSNDVVSKYRKAYPEVGKLAARLKGRIRGIGMHAGGVVVSKHPISKYAPMETAKDSDSDERVPLVAYDMNEVAEIGLIKLDILGLKTLDVIKDTMDWVGLTVEDMEAIDRNDPALIKMFNDGETGGVFQCDTNPYTRLLKEMPVRSFEDLVASNALIRPGAMNTVGKDFIARSEGRQRIKYVHESVREVLTKTYGTIVYQEQVMQTAVQLGGMTWSQADKLRKIIGKKKDPAEFAQYKESFMEGASKHVPAAAAAKLWRDFEAHAGYSFNRSHAVAYSKLSVWTMWLKHNYPEHYMAALLRNEKDRFKRTHYFIEVRKMEIPVELPNINESELSFTAADGKIMFGLGDMKYISEGVYAKLTKHRPFTSVQDLTDKAGQKYSGISTRTVDALRRSGALAPIGGPKPLKDDMYEFLSLPTFNVPEMPDAPITNVVDFDEESPQILSGMVQKIKKGKGWSLIDIVDTTGNVGFFDGQETEIQKNRYYYFLVNRNRIVTYLSADEVGEEIASNELSPLTEALVGDRMDMFEDRSRYVIHAKARTTRAGKRMADVFTLDQFGEVEALTVFANDFVRVVPRIKSGGTYDFKIAETKRGDLSIKDVR